MMHQGEMFWIGSREEPEEQRPEVLYSTIFGTSRNAFPKILAFYVPDGALILDMTCAGGVFWRKVERDRYRVVRSDIAPWKRLDLRSDLRCMPFRDSTFDCVVLDPPWGNLSTAPRGLLRTYNVHSVRTPKGTRRLYSAGLREANRLLRPKGILTVKCQSGVDGGRQHWFEIDVFNEGVNVVGFRCEDHFFVVPQTRPPLRHPDRPQRHARKWGSAFWVFRKPGRRTKKESDS